MSRANKTARISTRGYYPPRGLYESMEPCEEEESQQQEVDSPTPAPMPELFQEAPKEEEPKEVKVVVLSDDDDEGGPISIPPSPTPRIGVGNNRNSGHASNYPNHGTLWLRVSSEDSTTRRSVEGTTGDS